MPTSPVLNDSFLSSPLIVIGKMITKLLSIKFRRLRGAVVISWKFYCLKKMIRVKVANSHHLTGVKALLLGRFRIPNFTKKN